MSGLLKFQEQTKSMDSAAVLSSRNDSVGHDTGESVSCISIEFYPICPTPLGELLWFNVYADNPDPAAFLALAKSVCIGEPLFVSPVDFIGIIENGPKPGECFRSVPGNSQNLNFHF